MDFRRLFDLFPYQQARFPQRTALAIRAERAWQYFSTGDCLVEIDRVSAGLLNLGLQKGDRMAIMTASGSPWWNFLDLGMQQIGVIPVPIHATVTPAELEFILRDAAPRYCVVANRELHDFVKSLRGNLPGLQGIFTLEALPDIPGWDQLTAHPTERHLETFTTLRGLIHEDDLATIIYTSGSTGQPKGVCLSHKNIISNIKSVIPLIPVNWESRVVSMLPLSHIFERMVVYTYIAVGASVHYLPRRETLLSDLQEVRPHYFTAVPRLVEKTYDLILAYTAGSKAIRRSIMRWAIALGMRFPDKRRLGVGYWLKRQIASWMVYRHWRKLLGGKVEGVVVGAAALRPELGRLFSAAGIPIREGYGLTESSPVLTFNRFEPGGNRFGTVGLPVPGVEIRIETSGEQEGEGEIVVRGPNIMLGYHQAPEETGQVLSPDGWLHTGDLGKFVNKNFLQITGRIRDSFKTTSGKFVAPEPLESLLRSSPFIEQCLVVGHNQPYLVALVVPGFTLLRQWCAENRVHWTAPQFMVLNPKVIELLRSEIDRLNESLPPFQQIRRFHLLFQEWTAEEGELTPTMKPRRNYLREKFAREISALYG